MTKTSGPAIAAVLLSHDQHVDNLDVAGRAFLEQTPLALTTQAGARRLGDPAQGLAPWQSLDLPRPDGRGRAASLRPAGADDPPGRGGRTKMTPGAPPQRPRLAWIPRLTSIASFVVVTGTLGIAAASWVVSVRQMRGMDMGAATDLGSLAFFMGVWMPMMAAMMLPGAIPAILRFVRADGRAVVAPLFAGSYLALWALVGLAVYAAYQPHGSSASGSLTIAAGIYELTPLKRNCRRLCCESVRSGFEFGLDCVGSSAGLMVMLVALGVMSVTLMAVVAAVVLAQKLLPPSASIDVPVALTIVGLGIVIIVAPAAVPGFVPTMQNTP